MLMQFNYRTARLSLMLAVAATAAPALAESDWRFAANGMLGSTEIVVQVEKETISRNGGLVRYWVRFVDLKWFLEAADLDEMMRRFDSPKIIGVPSLYQNNCGANQTRIVQGDIILGYQGPSLPLNRPGAWQFIAPDSVMSAVHSAICETSIGDDDD